MFETADIPINFAIGIPFDETQVGQWIRLFFELARHDFRNQDMLGLFSIPVCRYWLKAVGVESEPAAMQSQLQRLIAEYDLATHLDAYFDAARAASKQEDTRELLILFEALQTALAPLLRPEAPSYREWGEALWQFSEALRLLEIFAWNSEDPYNLNMRALRHWYAFLKV
ncbi:MAG: hypothetical protein Q9P14_05640 [candidate division KSB1 bacterium]|nr:hypothetical protein [candidate division KSB1 bacterium]